MEDDEDDFLLTSELLQDVVGVEYEIAWITDPMEAIELLTNTDAEPSFDVCLLDFRLGAATALDVLTGLQSGGVLTPVVVLTGQEDTETDRAVMAAGASDYLVKGSFDSPTLERSLRYSVGQAEIVRSLRESEARFRSVVEAATDAIALLAHDGQILATNKASRSIFGCEDNRMVGLNFFHFLAPASVEMLVPHFASIDHNETVQAGPLDAWGVRLDDTPVPLEISVSTWTSGGERFWSVIARDVTERRALSDRLVHQAFHDPLTGLANRVLLRDVIRKRLMSHDRSGMSALLFLDIDNFKLINDTFGHEAGDDLLIGAGTKLLDCVRGHDTVARLGGDEFAIFLNNLPDAAMAATVAQRVVDQLSEPVTLNGLPVVATASIGVALAGSSDTPEELIRNADVAMYSAKAAGRNRYSLFEYSMHDATLERMRIEQDLREAISKEEITMRYQPIVDICSGKISGFEALARWNRKHHGAVRPDVFIAVAEDAGLIEDLGRLVLHDSVRQVATWQKACLTDTPITISVNLSTRQLEDPDLVTLTRSLLEETALARGSLTLEVTESVMVGHVDRAISVLNELRDLDVRLALDDFGTGYSSLSYLHMLPLDSLKADRSFVSRCHEQSGEAILKAVVAIAQSLGLKTVAEGIEEPDQQRRIAELGYDFGQGYLFAKPLLPEDALALLQEKAACKMDSKS